MKWGLRGPSLTASFSWIAARSSKAPGRICSSATQATNAPGRSSARSSITEGRPMNYTFDFTPVFEAWPTLVDGIVGTLRMSSISMMLGLGLGSVFMLMRMSKQPARKVFAAGYIEMIRSTPILVQVFFVFFGLPAMGVRLSGEQAAILTMTLNCAAYAAEIVRGGVQSIRAGQIEAGRALGMHTFDIYRFIVFRPAIRAVYPALCSQFILMMLNSSLMSSVS